MVRYFFYLCPAKNYRTDRWCNGSTADFGSACSGSNPDRSAKNSHLSGGCFIFSKFTILILHPSYDI